MLLISIESNSFINAEVYGSIERKSAGCSMSDFTLNQDAHCIRLPFNRRIVGGRQDLDRPFDRAVVNGVTVNGFLSVPYRALSHGPVHTTNALADLLTWHHDHQVMTPFEQWIRENPLLRQNYQPSGGRCFLSVMFDQDHMPCLFYIKDGYIGHENITETSFIREGRVTSLVSALDLRRRMLQEQLDRHVETTSKILTDHVAEPHLLPNDLLQFIH